ncbi:MAG: hypothetical protein AB7I25_11190, partial [Vicinamibacterales bacterium]
MGVPQDPLTAADGDDVLAPGISWALAAERSVAIGDLRYDLTLAVPASARTPITGTVGVRFRLELPCRVVLDFAEPVHRLRSVEVNGQRARPALIHDHIVLEAADLTAGENV